MPYTRPSHLPDGHAASPHESGVLEHLPGYEVQKKLGQGGMGTVFLARQVKLDRLVAIKVLPENRTDDPGALARFEREMKAVGRLNHPHIVQAHDAGEVNQVPYLVMEYLDGLSLAELSQRLGPLPLPEACELIRQAALGLQFAHENGLVHRDVKPSNLMLTRRGQVKVLDLGLVRYREEAVAGAEMTSEGDTMGTPDYMAPEQAKDSRHVDIRADIYSLGCTLYTLLAGRPPFSGEKYAGRNPKIVGHLRDPIPLVTRFRTDVPTELATVLDRMLAKTRERRYQTPSQVADAVGPFATTANLEDLLARAEGKPATPANLKSPTTSAQFGPALVETHSEDAPPVPPPPATRVASARARDERPEPAADVFAEIHARSVLERRSIRQSPWFLAFVKSLLRHVPRSAWISSACAAAFLLLGVIMYVATDKGTVKIEFDDPNPNVQVRVDGNNIDIAGLEENPLRLSAGEHGLEVTSGEFMTVTQSFTVRRGEQEIVRITLEPKPDSGETVPRSLDTVDEAMERELAGILRNSPRPPEPPPWIEPVPGKDLAPEVTLIAQSESAIRERYRERLSKNDVADLNVVVQEILKSAKEPLSPTHERFAGLRLARNLAGECKDFATVMTCCEEFSNWYDVDTMGMKAATLWRYARFADTPALQEALAEASLRSGFEAMAVEDYRFLPVFIKVAKDVAAKTKLDYLTYQADFLATDAAAGRKGYEQVKGDAQRLHADPKDPQANLAVGKFFCFVKNDWRKGLAMIAAASDPQLSALAARDLEDLAQSDPQKPTAMEVKLNLADSWWDVAEKSAPQDQPGCRERAKYWYLKALGQCDPEKRQELSNRFLTRIDSVPSRPVSLRVKLEGRRRRTCATYLQRRDISSWSSHGTRADTDQPPDNGV